MAFRDVVLEQIWKYSIIKQFFSRETEKQTHAKAFQVFEQIRRHDFL